MAERWGRYRANIAAAYAALQLQNNIATRTALEDAPDEHRNWEWQYLHSQLDGASLVLTVPIKRVDSLVLSPSGRQIAVGCIVDADIFLYEVASGKLEAVLHSQSAAPASFVYRADGKQIASIGNDEGIHLWDPETGRELPWLGTELVAPIPHYWTRVAFNQSGDRIASFRLTYKSSEGTASRLWDATTGKEIAVLVPWQKGQGHSESSPGQVVFSPDGTRVAACAGEFVYVCDAATGRRLFELGPYESEVTMLAYRPDGKRLASCSEFSIILWDGETDKSVAEQHSETSRFWLIRFSPDASRLVSLKEYSDCAVRLQDANTGEVLAVMAGHKNNINAIAFSPDSQRIATGSTDQTARLWDGNTGQLLAVLRGHTGTVRHVVFGPLGTRVVTAADDATLRLWDARTPPARKIPPARPADRSAPHYIAIRPIASHPAGSLDFSLRAGVP